VPPSTINPVGACCNGNSCQDDTTQSQCEVGVWKGAGSDCSTACINCGNGCLDYGEGCDDGDSENGDGCDSKCNEENCWSCTEPAQFPVGPLCIGPSQCSEVGGKGCAVCGNSEVEVGEDCDDGNTAAGDCCSANCTFEANAAPCTDGTFCNGIEKCDGEGSCVNQGDPADCSGLSDQCAVGVCDGELDHCVADGASKEGDACTDDSECTIEGSGTCHNGLCNGIGTTLSPTCRWIVLGGSAGETVRVRNGAYSTADDNICGDTGRSGGGTIGSFIVTANTGEGIRFDAPAEILGDIATGGASLGTSQYADIPGTNLATIPGGQTMAKLPSGMVDTTGTHTLVQVCSDDQDKIEAARAILDAKPSSDDRHAYRIKSGKSDTIDVTGDGVSVIDMSSMRIGRRATLTLAGGPSDVVMLRITGGRVTFGFGASIALSGGLKPENVLIYSKWLRCRISPRVDGQGTLFCPEANRFTIGVGTLWSGTILGGAREIRIRYRVELTHVPFTGF
jgi:cysteine-rich repeat protein